MIPDRVRIGNVRPLERTREMPLVVPLPLSARGGVGISAVAGAAGPSSANRTPKQ